VDTFKYDPLGRRIFKSTSSATSIYAYDGENLIEEANSSGGVVARYEDTQNIDEPLAMLRSSATSYYNADGLGSVTSLTNSAGAAAETYTYDSFGKVTASSGSLTNPFQYTGREMDPESGLYYYRARYYDPNVGRFLNEDPLGFAPGPNFYAYVHNSPVSRNDPSGLWDSYTHSALYWNALKLCGVDDETIYQIQQASIALDANSQMPWEAFIHSMKAPFQSAADALQERDTWISDNLADARAAYTSPGSTAGVPWTTSFAWALHPITDSTSPAHMQNGSPLTWPTLPNALKHGDLPDSIETWSNMTPDLMKLNIEEIQKAYEKVTGKKCGCQE
jgi:RHS repeat-associated protein